MAVSLVMAKVEVHAELPQHLIDKFNIRTPEMDSHREIPQIDFSKIKPKPKDPLRKKTIDEIPRVKDEHIHIEPVKADEHTQDDDHLHEALRLQRLYKGELKNMKIQKKADEIL